jgi:hypothetical protein
MRVETQDINDPAELERILVSTDEASRPDGLMLAVDLPAGREISISGLCIQDSR